MPRAMIQLTRGSSSQNIDTVTLRITNTSRPGQLTNHKIRAILTLHNFGIVW